jgi:hypothetical protein
MVGTGTATMVAFDFQKNQKAEIASTSHLKMETFENRKIPIKSKL